nr:ribonuclease H-like domain-containing protein [Tanacetum cinerariifolium]
AKPCQEDSSEFYLITGSIYNDQQGTVVIATIFDVVTKTLSSISVDYLKPKPAVLKLKKFKKDALLKLFKLSNQERYEHVGQKVTSAQGGKDYKMIKRDYAWLMISSREPHLAALKRILCYVYGTLDYGLQLYSSSISSLVAYSDADWAGLPTARRFTSDKFERSTYSQLRPKPEAKPVGWLAGARPPPTAQLAQCVAWCPVRVL